MRQDIAALMARDEHDAGFVEVQHILISFVGAGTRQQRRTKEAAEVLAAEVYRDALDGLDFADLVMKYTDDSPPGIYGMSSPSAAPGSAPPGTSPRTGMVAAFGDVGWRLQVGEIGVAGFDAQKSPYGWHIIKRLK